MRINEVADIIDTEGLEHAILGYIDEDEISDPRLRKLWISAKRSMTAILEIVEPKEYDFDEDDSGGDDDED